MSKFLKVSIRRIAEREFEIYCGQYEVSVHPNHCIRVPHNKCNAYFTLTGRDCNSQGAVQLASVMCAVADITKIIDQHGWRCAWKACYKFGAPFMHAEDLMGKTMKNKLTSEDRLARAKFFKDVKIFNLANRKLVLDKVPCGIASPVQAWNEELNTFANLPRALGLTEWCGYVQGIAAVDALQRKDGYGE